MTRLDADLIARALIGAAYLCEVPPLEVFGEGRGKPRARLLAAAAARRAGLGSRETLRRAFGVGHANQLSPYMLGQAHITDQMVRAVMAGAGLVDAPTVAFKPRPIPVPRPAAPTFRQTGLSHARGKPLSAGQQAIFDAMLGLADGEWIVTASLVQLERLANAPPHSAANRLWGLRRKGYIEVVGEPTSHTSAQYHIAEAHRPIARPTLQELPQAVAAEPAPRCGPVFHKARSVEKEDGRRRQRSRTDVTPQIPEGVELPDLGANTPDNARPVAFTDRGPGCCCWPIEATLAPSTAQMLVCGAPSDGEGPYCASHADRAYRGAPAPRAAPGGSSPRRASNFTAERATSSLDEVFA